MAPVAPRAAKPEPEPTPEPEAVSPPSATDEDAAPRTVFNGLMRASTMWLLVVFGVTVLVRGLTLTPGADSDAHAGVLAPPQRTTATTSPAESTTAFVTTNPSTPPTRSQTPTTAPSPTPETEQEPEPTASETATWEPSSPPESPETSTLPQSGQSSEPTSSAAPLRGILD